MTYALTVIFHGGITPTEFFQLQTFIHSLPLKVIDIVTLSENKVYDFIVTLKKVENSIDEKGEDDLIHKIRNNISDADLIEINDLIGRFDLIIQKHNEFRKDKKLFCFDMDSTLITQEVIELIAEYAGVEDQVEAITTRAMNGELDFKESLFERVKLLKGIDGTIWKDLEKKLIFTKGVFKLIKGLKKTGCKTAVLSGGFIELATFVKNTLDLDYAFANKLETEVNEKGETVFSGRTVGEIVDGVKKAQLTKYIAELERIDLKQAVCVGDGSNDLLMMATAGWGVAWNAKPKVQKLAPCKLNSDDISDIFYILGYNDEEIKKLTE